MGCRSGRAVVVVGALLLTACSSEGSTGGDPTGARATVATTSAEQRPAEQHTSTTRNPVRTTPVGSGDPVTADPAPTTLTAAVPASTASPATTIEPTTTEAATTTEASTTTDATTTTIDPLQLAREAFYVIVTTGSRSGAAVAEQFPITGWSAYPAYCAAMGPVAGKLADDVTAHPWPPEAAVPAKDLAAAHAYLAALYANCAATDGSYEALVAIDASLREVEDYVSRANVEMRVAIGLPADR